VQAGWGHVTWRLLFNLFCGMKQRKIILGHVV